MPVLESKIGLARAASWSIWSETISLIPVLLSFFLSPPPPSHKAPVWNQSLLFAGLALSRIGLWSFDLCQLKLLQRTLAEVDAQAEAEAEAHAEAEAEAEAGAEAGAEAEVHPVVDDNADNERNPHPHRRNRNRNRNRTRKGNTIAGLQFALQNALDVLRYAMLVVFSRPSQFKYTATLSFAAVLAASLVYLVYLRRERGHVVHLNLEWVGRVKGKFM